MQEEMVVGHNDRGIANALEEMSHVMAQANQAL